MYLLVISVCVGVSHLGRTQPDYLAEILAVNHHNEWLNDKINKTTFDVMLLVLLSWSLPLFLSSSMTLWSWSGCNENNNTTVKKYNESYYF